MTGQAPSDPHDVVIVGGGAVGLLLACLLAARAVDVVVLERRLGVGAHTRAIGIHPPGLAALESAGVGEAVRAAAAPIRHGIAMCQGRELGRIRFEGAPIRSLPQPYIEALLEARLADLAPGALRRGVEVTGVRDRGAEVVVGAIGVNGEESALAARYVVAADGVHSVVRGLLGIERTTLGRPVDYAMADLRDSTGPPDTALLHLEPEGVVESFPLPDGGRRWVARLQNRPTVMETIAFGSLVRARVRADLGSDATSRTTVFTARQRIARVFVRGRIVLVGDAAHEVSPIGGQGMNLGWLGAVRLERSLVEALAGRIPPTGFPDYERAQRASASRAMRQAAFNMAMGAPQHGVRLRGRNAFARVLIGGPTRQRLADAFTMIRL